MSRSNSDAPWLQQGGVTQFTRSEGQRFARQILESQTYRDWLEERLKNKSLDPSIERMLWAYGYGKPPEHINLTVTQQEDLSSLSIAELQQRAAKLQEELQEAQAVESALPADVVKGPW